MELLVPVKKPPLQEYERTNYDVLREREPSFWAVIFLIQLCLNWKITLLKWRFLVVSRLLIFIFILMFCGFWLSLVFWRTFFCLFFAAPVCGMSCWKRNVVLTLQERRSLEVGCWSVRDVVGFNGCCVQWLRWWTTIVCRRARLLWDLSTSGSTLSTAAPTTSLTDATKVSSCWEKTWDFWPFLVLKKGCLGVSGFCTAPGWDPVTVRGVVLF